VVLSGIGFSERFVGNGRNDWIWPQKIGPALLLELTPVYIFCGILNMKWTVETLNEIVDAEVESLPADMRARLTHIAKLIEEMGLERVGEPHVKHLDGRLWEMRLKGRSGISRALYVVATGKRVVIVRAFIKKTQKTPRHEIDLALTRAKVIP
jgi:phage-related protein